VKIEGDRILFMGRADSLLAVGGAKVRPEEVEAVVLRVPGVLDARVRGMRNPLSGQLVGVEIVAGKSADREALRRRIIESAAARLEPYKVPRIFHFVESMGMSGSGKKERRT
jgi:acyl-coenzyme A synthetase/AMP-(fatty) acid ligase